MVIVVDESRFPKMCLTKQRKTLSSVAVQFSWTNQLRMWYQKCGTCDFIAGSNVPRLEILLRFEDVEMVDGLLECMSGVLRFIRFFFGLFDMDLSKDRLPENVVENPFLRVPLGHLTDVGVIISSYQSKWHILKGYITYIMLIIFTMGQFFLAATSKETGVVVVYGAIAFCMVSGGLRLIYFLLVKRKEFFEIICIIDTDIMKSKANATPQEMKILKGYHTYIGLLSKFLARSSFFSVLILLLVHIWLGNFKPLKILGMNPLPPLIRCKVCQENNIFSVYLVNIFNAYMVYLCAKSVPNVHALFCAMTTFVVMNLRLLNHKLEFLHEYVTEKDIVLRNEQAYKLLVECIERHRNIKRYLDKLQEMSGKFLFFDFIIYSVQLCFMLYQIVGSTDFGMLMFNVNYTSTLVTILWLYYYHGNEIIYQSDQISTSIYLSNWYEFDLKFRKAMLQFMTSSYEPMKMYAGIIEINIPNFIGIIKAGYSYLTILRQRPT